MSKVFTIQLTAPPEAVIAAAKIAAQKNGVALEGDATQGQFDGHGIKGTYDILDQTLSVSIAKKPLVMPWGMIEKTLTNFFTKGA
ncbi:MAG: hypothetical protein D4R76_00420 [Methylococcus sp.]|jgi:hypothetical protein|nr:MAG: hypothetical protein D4R76_00420 [Methylococcus sp.]